MTQTTAAARSYTHSFPMYAVMSIKPLVRRRPWSAVVLALAGLVLAFAAVQTVRTLAGSYDLGFGLILILPRLLELGLVTGGLVLVARGMPYRVGDSLHCSRCGYERIEERDRLLVNCPECGLYWRLFGGWRSGRPLGNRRLVRIGMLVVGAGLLATGGRELAGRWLAEQMGSAMLIRHVLYAPSETTGVTWQILSRRALTRPQAQWLAEDLLRRRAQRGSLDLRAVEWLHARIADGTLDQSIATRYFEETADFWIEAPAETPVGRTFEVSLRGVYRGPAIDSPDGPITVMTEGVTIELPAPPKDDQRSEFEKTYLSGPTTLAPQGASGFLINPTDQRRMGKIAAASASSQFLGVAKIRAVVWILVGPEAGESAEIKGGAGTPPATLSPQRRAYRREIEREIEIAAPRP